MQLKKLLLVSWFFYPKLGGAESLMLEQALYFSRKGYQVSVLTYWQEGLASEENFRNIQIIRRSFIDSRTDKVGVIREELGPIIDKINPDIVHFHNASNPCASSDKIDGAKNIVECFRIIKSKGIKAIEHVHNAQLKSPENTKVLRDLDWDYLIFVSTFVQKKWQELGFKSKKFKVVHNGIDIKPFAEALPNKEVLSIKKDNVLIFFPARVISVTMGILSAQKNFILLLKAVSLLKKKNISNFKILALMNEALNKKAQNRGEKYVNKFIKIYGLEENIIFFSGIPPEQMPGYYAASDIVCVPSIEETFGLVYLEAMAAGKIAIASNTGGPLEFIENGKTGFLVDPDNEEELAKVLEEMINSAQKRKEIGDSAKISAENYSIENCMKKIENIYKELL